MVVILYQMFFVVLGMIVMSDLLVRVSKRAKLVIDARASLSGMSHKQVIDEYLLIPKIVVPSRRGGDHV